MKKISYLLSAILLFTFACQKTEVAKTDYNITCYAATYSEGIYKSDNGGKSWYPMKMDQEDIHLYFKRLFLNAEKDTLYIATTGAGLFTIDLKNESLKRIDQFRDQNIRTIAFTNNMESGKQEVLVGMFETGILIKKTSVNGVSTPMIDGLTYRDVNTIITADNSVFAGTIKDVFKWNESSKAWNSAAEGIKNKNIISLAVNPKGDVLYAGAGGYDGKKGRFEDIPCLYKSSDNGKTWEESDDGIPDNTLVYKIAVNNTKPERIYLGTSDGIYRSDDSGNDWSKTDEGLSDDFRVFDIKITHMVDGNDLIYAAGSKGIFMSVDTDDQTWTGKNYGLPRTNITGIVLKN